MSRMKEALKRRFHQLPCESKIKLYRCLYQGRTLMLSDVRAWLQQKCSPPKEDVHDLFLDYSQPQGVYTAASLVERLSDFDVVSFDIFDTLLFRRVAKPADVFSLMEQQLGLSGFAAYRAQSEQNARARQHKKSGSWEVSFLKIYEQMIRYTAEQRAALQGLELSLEKKQLFANPVMRQLAEALQTMRIPLLAISDMYLGSDTLAQFLQSCGFHGFGKIYVSSEEGVSKSDGGLFQRVSQLERWEGKRVAHIGDNFHSDVVMGKKWIEMPIHYLR